MTSNLPVETLDKYAKDRPVRRCTDCDRGLRLEEILYSSSYPERVETTGKRGWRPGSLKDAERVWCSVACARRTWMRQR